MLGKDSFFLARLANGGVVGRGPDELSRVSEMFRPVAERLLAVSPEGRQRVCDDFLAGRLRPSPIIEAVHELEPPTAASSLERAVPDPPQPTPNHHGENAAEPERRLRLTCAVNLAPREVEWLWAGRVPLGMITMFAGDPKLGKSYVTLAMAAAVSRGLPLDPAKDPSFPPAVEVPSASTSRIQRALHTQSSPSVTRKIKCPTGNSAETGKASHKRVVLTPTTITFSTKPHITSPAITSCFLP
jgi:hypothetical protein